METAVKQAVRAHVRVYDDYETMSIAASRYVIDRVDAAISGSGRAAIALSGGSTPRRLYSLLGASSLLDWSRVHFFWADERCVAPDDAKSNFRLANSGFLSRVAAPDRNIHRIRGELGVERASQEYEKNLRLFFDPLPLPVFDLVILGVGMEGHTASLFPGSSALAERVRWAIPQHFEIPETDRVTLSLNVLNSSREVLFLVSGREKAAILHELLEDGNPRHCPAGLVAPESGAITWFLDRNAARLLSL